MDKFIGMLECSFEEFLLTDVKEYHIMYFKEGDRLVWDRKTRLDIL